MTRTMKLRPRRCRACCPFGLRRGNHRRHHPLPRGAGVPAGRQRHHEQRRCRDPRIRASRKPGPRSSWASARTARAGAASATRTGRRPASSRSWTKARSERSCTAGPRPVVHPSGRPCLGLLLPAARFLGPVGRGAARATSAPSIAPLRGPSAAGSCPSNMIDTRSIAATSPGVTSAPSIATRQAAPFGTAVPVVRSTGWSASNSPPGDPMRQEAVVRQEPQLLVEPRDPRGVRPADRDAPPRALRPREERGQRLLKRLARHVVEPGRAHQPSNRSRISRSSAITPQPVAPFGASVDVRRARSADARDVEVASTACPRLTKRCRNCAAVIEPAGAAADVHHVGDRGSSASRRRRRPSASARRPRPRPSRRRGRRCRARRRWRRRRRFRGPSADDDRAGQRGEVDHRRSA